MDYKKEYKKDKKEKKTIYQLNYIELEKIKRYKLFLKYYYSNQHKEEPCFIYGW